MNGDSLQEQQGSYGIQGSASAFNKPRARQSAVNWIDAAGNLWLFGGYAYNPLTGNAGPLNDLWKYDPSINQWTWMGGDNAIRRTGHYGTKGVANAANKPGSRQTAVGWTDNAGNLWMFGGTGYTSRDEYGLLNDLWKYNMSLNQWTWVSGKDSVDVRGVYGNKGFADASNYPGARENAVGWSDGSGNFWLFGGSAVTITGSGTTNDLWKYSLLTSQWTWMNGRNGRWNSGTYGVKGVPEINNTPGARENPLTWTDAAGNLWLFGGTGFAVGSAGNLNDLWRYTPATSQWTWMSGDNSASQPAVYGSRGIASPFNKPSARYSSLGWADPAGNLWLYSGNTGIRSSAFIDDNDLWKYTVSGTSLPVQFTNFTASKLEQTVVLNWKTAQEQNSHYFVVERSPNASVYSRIGELAAKGTSFSATSYTFTDITPMQGINYYRLKQIDKDGRFMYSAVAKIVMDQDAVHFAVMQNPVQNSLQLNIQLPSARKMQLQVRNAGGSLLMNKEMWGSKGSLVYTIPIVQLARGTYYIHLKTEGSGGAKTFIKQ